MRLFSSSLVPDVELRLLRTEGLCSRRNNLKSKQLFLILFSLKLGRFGRYWIGTLPFGLTSNSIQFNPNYVHPNIFILLRNKKKSKHNNYDFDFNKLKLFSAFLS